jgi:hypothetical protein
MLKLGHEERDETPFVHSEKLKKTGNSTFDCNVRTPSGTFKKWQHLGPPPDQ